MERSATLGRFFVGAGIVLLALAPFTALTAQAVVLEEPSAAAYSYGVDVDVTLLSNSIPVNIGPLIESTQALPGVAPISNSLIHIGPIPNDGSLIEHAGVLESSAVTEEDPTSTAKAEVASVKLLKSGDSALITADVVKAQANADCTSTPNGNGTTFVNLVINGTPIEATPAPNTVIDLQIAKVILNEQHPAANGRGFVVNALHLVSTSTGDALFRGDVIVSHAVATVSCPQGPGTTGGSNEVKLSKTASSSTVKAGDQFTYTASLTDSGAQDCLVNKLIEHLAAPFDLVSTSGALGTGFSTKAASTGGTDIILGNGSLVPASQTKTQTFVVKVRSDAKPGVWFNDMEILCANLGDYIMGLGAPVAVLGTTASPSPNPSVTPTTSSTVVPGPGESPEATPTTRVLGRRLAATGTELGDLARLLVMMNAGGTSVGLGMLFRRKAKNLG